MDREVQVRPATPDDAQSIAEIYAPVVLSTPTSFEETPPDAQEFRRRMATAPRLPWLVANVGQQVVGYAYATRFRARAAYRWSAECSAYVAEGHRGKRVGRRLYEELAAVMRDLRYVSLLAGITLPNAASVALHEAVGFTPIGVFRHVGFKHGAWHDVGWWELALGARSPLRPTGHTR
jgi:phosphinothricin acetyltransferase